MRHGYTKPNQRTNATGDESMKMATKVDTAVQTRNSQRRDSSPFDSAIPDDVAMFADCRRG